MLNLKAVTTHFTGKTQTKVLQNLVHIMGEDQRYTEPFVADGERGCQRGGSYKAPLSQAKCTSTVKSG